MIMRKGESEKKISIIKKSYSTTENIETALGTSIPEFKGKLTFLPQQFLERETPAP